LYVDRNIFYQMKVAMYVFNCVFFCYLLMKFFAVGQILHLWSAMIPHSNGKKFRPYFICDIICQTLP